MPIYEYSCTACGHRLEAMQRMSDAPLQDCPACGEPSLKKLVSAPAFRLKGGGWYETDFKKDGKRNLADGAGGQEKKGEGSADKAKPESSSSPAAQSGGGDSKAAGSGSAAGGAAA